MIQIKAPGRICLFGEHQDYLNYPVIAMAISKYIYLKAKKVNSQNFIIRMPDIKKELEIPLKNKILNYNSNRDYLRSGYNQFIRKGIKFSNGYEITITGDIPINAGASSSSALVIAWLFFLNLISGVSLNKTELAKLGYQTEVAEFGEAGGQMDFFSSVLGEIIYLKPEESTPIIESYPFKIKRFILGNSLEKKETVEDLKRVKELSIESFLRLKELYPEFDRFNSKLGEIKPYLESLKKKYQDKIIGNIINRDLTLKAKSLISSLSDQDEDSRKRNKFNEQLGQLITSHQDQLRESIQISTKKIDVMISKSLEAGALGAKINGSGFGGTMFALAQPGREQDIINAIENAGGKAYHIDTSKGVEER